MRKPSYAFVLQWSVTALALIFPLAGCSGAPKAPVAGKPHHTAQGFQNNYDGNVVRPFSDLLRWKAEQFRNNLPPDPKVPTPMVKPDLTFIHANARAGVAMVPAVTWIGHASALVQASGLNVLTDPIFSERAFPVQFAGPKRMQAPGVLLADMPHVDVVVISHNHYDHLDRNSVFALSQQVGGSPLFIVPLGLKAWMEGIGISNVRELDWWQSVTVGQVEFVLTPVQHWSARGLGDRRETLWGGWAALGPDFHWYYSGDTGYSQDFADTRARFAERQSVAKGGGFDLALIAIGAYEPRWFMKEQHLNPAESVQVHRDVGAKRSVGVHWGTFNLTDEPLDQPPQDLAVARKAANLQPDDFFVLAVGETRRLPGRLGQ
jgi:N-acyl-phosphatidylethanolamine-hydrolysing phospholipase D